MRLSRSSAAQKVFIQWYFPNFAHIIIRANCWMIQVHTVDSNNINVSTSGISSCEADSKVPSSDADNILGQVWVGIDNRAYLYSCQFSQRLFKERPTRSLND